MGEPRMKVAMQAEPLFDTTHGKGYNREMRAGMQSETKNNTAAEMSGEASATECSSPGNRATKKMTKQFVLPQRYTVLLQRSNRDTGLEFSQCKYRQNTSNLGPAR